MQSSPQSSPAPKARILVVEDEVIIAHDILVQLNELGYETVGHAKTGAQAVALAGELRPDLVLMDIQLAGAMNGITAAETVRVQFNLPVIFLTATADDDILAQAMLTEPFGYIIKPFSERELRTAIEIARYKHRIEARARASEADRLITLERYNTILAATTEGLLLLRADGRTIECNPAGQKLLGLTREVILGSAAPDLRWRGLTVGGADIPDAELPAMVTIRTGRAIRDFEMGILRPDGTQIRVLVNTEPIRDPTGRVTHAVATLSDITAQRQAELAQRRSDERLRTAIAASKMVWWEWQMAAGGFHVSASGLPCILGYTTAQMAGFTAGDWISKTHPDDRPRVEATLARARAGHTTPWHCDHRMLDAAGAWRWVRHTGHVSERADDGAARLMVGTTQDVHEQQLGAEQIQITAMRLQLALDAAQLGIWRYDLQTQTMEWDQRTREIFGLGPDQEAPDWTLFNRLVYPDDRAVLNTLPDAVRGGQTHFDYIFRIRRPDGETRHVQSTCSVQADAHGQPGWITGTNADVTEKIAADLRRRELETQLTQSQKLETLGTLAGGIAHEFNNLLTGIMGFNELALQALKADHPLAGYLRQVRDAGLQARDLIKRVLLVARRAPEANMQTLALSRLVLDLIPLLTATLPSSIEIHQELTGTSGAVVADPAQMQQILMNLCVNAADAIGPQQGRITVGVRSMRVGPEDGLACPPGPYVCLAVADTGCGMDEATQLRIFDPFYTTKAPGEGTGLGLSIVRSIVAEHGGAIRLSSTLGAGARFEIYLPESVTEPTAQPVAAAPASTLQGAGRRVLVTDDEKQVLGFVSSVLAAAGFEVVACADGQAAQRQFAAAPATFALALIDLTMPRLTGLELIPQLRALRSDLPIILMSGDHDRFKVIPGLGTHEYVRLDKPFSSEELLAVFRETLPVTTGGPPV